MSDIKTSSYLKLTFFTYVLMSKGYFLNTTFVEEIHAVFITLRYMGYFILGAPTSEEIILVL